MEIDFNWVTVSRTIYAQVKETYEKKKPLQVIGQITDMDGFAYEWSNGTQHIETVWGYLVDNDDFDDRTINVARYQKLGETERFEIWARLQLPSLDALVSA